MDQVIVGFHLDEQQHWIAKLACGHSQHLRHQPPWQNRAWVFDHHARLSRLGQTLYCTKCLKSVPADWI
ncbi:MULTISPECIES: DUF3565 domain-containing protein [unclassified Agarivorans]|uniref:DUF3565 domain-containing protein n=1 Tax=unclassified Agarivorans TaxID=2636026 RepID=UPI003D7C6D9B